jgi:hypothetical protein
MIPPFMRRIESFLWNPYSYIKQSDMIHPENWERLSREFSVSVGMLVWNGNTEGIGGLPALPPALPPIHGLILRGITEGNYDNIRREVLRLERTLRTNTSELTLYKKAIKSDIRAKSNEVF